MTSTDLEVGQALAIIVRTEMARPLYVTRPMLPNLEDLFPRIEEIWRTQFVTNGGPMHEQLETELAKFLDVPTAMLFNNGTIALLAALKLFNLPIGSEVITTPLTFAATAHSIWWNGLTPVFADVHPETLTLDPASVRKAITPRTSAILGVHVYGTICHVDELQQIASTHGLRLIYDAAHAFGVTVDGRPISGFGDASVFSFHATKLFTTLEGGLIATPRAEDRAQIYFLRNFGIKNEEEVVTIGINGKMNEIQAAIGLLNLPRVNAERAARAELRVKYENVLAEIPGITPQLRQQGVVSSEQYFPVVIDAEKFGRSRDQIYDELKARGILSRKYFHPICTDFEPYRDWPIASVRNVPHALIVKSQVLCLPFFSGVTDEDVEDISAVFHSGAAVHRAVAV
jgi:dTDP-4-amino-4,6-dideoxygalactose transaminase